MKKTLNNLIIILVVIFVIMIAAVFIINRTDDCEHALVHYNAVAATCTEDGSIEYYHCTKCGKNFADEDAGEELEIVTIAATGHDWDSGVIVAEATSIEDGSKIYTCTVCGETKSEALHYYNAYETYYDDDGYLYKIRLICNNDENHTEYHSVVYYVPVTTAFSSCSEQGATTTYFWTDSEINWDTADTYTFVYTDIYGSNVAVVATKNSDGTITYDTPAETSAVVNYFDAIVKKLELSAHHSYLGDEIDETLTTVYEIDDFINNAQYTVSESTDDDGNEILIVTVEGVNYTLLRYVIDTVEDGTEEYYAYLVCRDCGESILVRINPSANVDAD